MGYKNKTIHMEFPDLTEDDADAPISITIKNPKTLPMGDLIPGDVDAEDRTAQMAAMFAMMANMIVAWHVFDQQDALMEMPATAESVAGLPMMITNWITEQIKGVVTTPQ